MNYITNIIAMNKITLRIFIILLVFSLFSVNTYSNFEPVAGINGKIIALYFHGNDLYAGIENGGAKVSVNNGNTWQDATGNMGINVSVNKFTSIGNTVFAATALGVFSTTDKGTSWTLLNNGLMYSTKCVVANGSDLYASNMLGQVYKSSNMGSSWSQIWITFPDKVNDILFHTNGIFIACADIYYSTNNGTSWNSENPPGMSLNTLYAVGNTIRAAGSGGYINTNSTGGWVNEQPWGNWTFGFATVGSYVLHAGIVGIFWSSDYGVTWNHPGTAYQWMVNFYSMTQNGQYVFAGSTDGIYRKTIASFTGITQTSNNIPDKFSLSQNYPNPFNPETNIKFGLPKQSHVSLIVYNQLGQSVAELVNSELAAGEYQYNFDAARLPSGIYYYKLQSGDFSETKKMILVK